jgi:arylsulfatase A-like enzyme
MYEESIRVPLIVWSPSLLSGRGEVSQLVQSFDLVPALLSMAEVETPAWFESESLLPALRGEPFDGRAAVYAEQGRDVVFQFADFVSMLRTERWKLVNFLGEEFGQLFDLLLDPAEERNLWSDSAHRSVRVQLENDLYQWRMRSAYQTRDWTAAFR